MVLDLRQSPTRLVFMLWRPTHGRRTRGRKFFSKKVANRVGEQIVGDKVTDFVPAVTTRAEHLLDNEGLLIAKNVLGREWRAEEIFDQRFWHTTW